MKPNLLSSTSIPLHYFTNDHIIQHYKSELLKLLLNKWRINKQEERDFILCSVCIFQQITNYTPTKCNEIRWCVICGKMNEIFITPDHVSITNNIYFIQHK
jgi:hypothetical protein